MDANSPTVESEVKDLISAISVFLGTPEFKEDEAGNKFWTFPRPVTDLPDGKLDELVDQYCKSRTDQKCTVEKSDLEAVEPVADLMVNPFARLGQTLSEAIESIKSLPTGDILDTIAAPAEPPEDYYGFDILPTDSAERKKIPLYSGLLKYFPLACAAVSNLSMEGNLKHAPDEELHWKREASCDHEDCIARHLVDGDYRNLAWRALALLELAEEQRLCKEVEGDMRNLPQLVPPIKERENPVDLDELI